MQNTYWLTAFLLLFSIHHLQAQWEWENAAFSNLDLGYELNGFITLDNEEKGDGVVQMILQPDGKTLLLGYSGDTSNLENQHVLIRLNEDGNLDASFGEDGMVKLPMIKHENREYGWYKDYEGIALQSTNKIIVLGNREERPQNTFLLMRYTSEGKIDTTFEKKEVVLSDNSIWSEDFKLCIQRDDKLLVASSEEDNLMLMRFSADGDRDTTFGDGGKVITDIGKRDAPAKILLQDDQKIIVIGRTNNYAGEKSEFALARFFTNGNLDPSFGQEGIVKTTIGLVESARPADGVIQADGKIIVMGSAMGRYQPDYAMVRYLPNGRLDRTFGNQGKTITNVSKYGDRGEVIVLQPDGKILVAGNSREWATHLTLIRYHANGKLDYSFGDKGKQRPYLSRHGSGISSMALQGDKIILAGGVRLESRPNNDFLLIRFLSDFSVGTINFQAQTNNALVYPNPIQKEAIFEYTLAKEEVLTIQLTDLDGRILKTYLQNKRQKVRVYQQTIDLPEDLPYGMYLVRLISKNGQYVVKVVK